MRVLRVAVMSVRRDAEVEDIVMRWGRAIAAAVAACIFGWEVVDTRKRRCEKKKNTKNEEKCGWLLGVFSGTLLTVFNGVTNEGGSEQKQMQI